jgi:hypothetical protein
LDEKKPVPMAISGKQDEEGKSSALAKVQEATKKPVSKTITINKTIVATKDISIDQISSSSDLNKKLLFLSDFDNDGKVERASEYHIFRADTNNRTIGEQTMFGLFQDHIKSEADLQTLFTRLGMTGTPADLSDSTKTKALRMEFIKNFEEEVLLLQSTLKIVT